jgi:hypothetical protein
LLRSVGPVGLDAVQLTAARGLRLLALRRAACAAGVKAGMRPSGGSITYGRHAADAARAFEPVRRRRHGAADGAERGLELLGAIERELVAVVVGHVLVALRDALLELVVAQPVARCRPSARAPSGCPAGRWR